MKNIYLIEDHDQALKVWRQNKLKGLDLVHLDAHIDFGIPSSKPIEKIIKGAQTLKELKKGLEHSIAFMRYEKDFDKQTDLGNYIYPAMEEGIVKNFYWVVPGGVKEFKESYRNIRNILRNILKASFQKIEIKKERKKAIISVGFTDKKIIVCNLKNLPVFKQNVLLDIDTDFLVIDNLLNADSTTKIGKRKPWILPRDLVEMLKNKIKKPKITTIAYSVNGGWTPIKYKHLGDEIAYYFAPQKFKKHLRNSLKAAQYFNLFTSTGKKEYYQKAINLNTTYRAADNNYGPLYLSLGKYLLAEKEFQKILKVDPKNTACLLGLGNIALEKKHFNEAKKYFSAILNSRTNKLFSEVKSQGLLGLAKAKFNLENYSNAKRLLCRYQAIKPLNPESYYFLARIYEKEREFQRSVALYKDTFSLGFNDSLEVIHRLLKISRNIREKEKVIKYAVIKYNNFKRMFIKSLKRLKNTKYLYRIKKKMATIEKMLKSVSC